MTARAIRYAGIPKDRRPVTGRDTTGDVAAWIEDRFKRGWRRLSVTADGGDHVIGWIGPKTEGGGRGWWAES